MHDLISGLDRCEDQLRDVTKAMKDCKADAMGSSELDGAVGDLAGRMGDKIDKLGEAVDGILDRLKACVGTYEKVDQGWHETFGGSAGGIPGAAGGGLMPVPGGEAGDGSVGGEGGTVGGGIPGAPGGGFMPVPGGGISDILDGRTMPDASPAPSPQPSTGNQGSW